MMKRQNVTLQQTIKFLISVLSFPSPVSLIPFFFFCVQLFQPKHIGIWGVGEDIHRHEILTRNHPLDILGWMTRETRDQRQSIEFRMSDTGVFLSVWLSVPTGLTVSRTDSSCDRQSVSRSLSRSFLSSGTRLLSPSLHAFGEKERNREKEKVLHVYFDFHGEEFVRSARQLKA